MAESFFGFNTSLTELELDDAPDLDEEEEYDALNHETFGENAFQGDWEEDHTRFAEVTENSRIYKNSCNSEKDEDDDDLDFETSISQLVLEDGEEEDYDDLNCAAHNKTSESISTNNFKLERSCDFNSSPVWSVDSARRDENLLSRQLQQTIQNSAIRTSSMQFLPPQIQRIQTVQELERDLIEKNKPNKTFVKQGTSNSFNQLPNQSRNFYGNVNQQQHMNIPNFNIQTQNCRSKFTQATGTSNKYPPGFGPHQRGPFPQPPQEMVLFRNNQNMPMLLGPRLLPPYLLPTPHPLLLTQNPRLVAPHAMMRFMPPHPVLMQQIQQQQQQHLHINPKPQRCNQNNPDNARSNTRTNNVNHNSNNGQGNSSRGASSERRGSGDYDEYAGLMTEREKQWLQNIQLIQLTADKPGICDYYYTEWSKRQEKKKQEQAKNGTKDDKKPQESLLPNNKQLQVDGKQREKKDSERELIGTPSPRVYVPLQFENSLGKLQCVSVTAPRKIIDLDIVPEPPPEVAPSTSHRDSRKTKNILLELERLHFWAIQIDDIDNGVPLENCRSSKSELLDKIMSNFLNEDRFVNFMCIRKGKTLLLRTLPKIGDSERKDQMSDLWCRIVKSFPVISRKDQNDSLLVQLHPFFKKWIESVEYVTLSLISTSVLSGNSQTNVKTSTRAASPNSGKSVLSSMLSNKFGVSAIACILSQGEVLYPSLGEKEKLDWSTYVSNFLKNITSIPNLENIPTPLDPLSESTSTAILNRNTGLHTQDHASAKRILSCFQTKQIDP